MDDISMELIKENLELKAKSIELERKLSEEIHKREEVEWKYNNLCENCIKMYVKGDIAIDTITLRVEAPRFMGDADFESGLFQHILNACLSKRLISR